MVFNGVTVVLFFGLIWIIGLTILVIRLIRHYNRLTAGVTKTGLIDILNIIVGKDVALEKRATIVEEEVKRLHNSGLGHIQRIGVVRFNPFADTGGNQSFTMAILDGQENGIVMTALYARSGNRWYVKEVEKGKGKNIELSKEEMTAIQKARRDMM